MNWPKEWKEVAFSDIAEFIGGGTPSTARSDFWGGDIHWTTSKRLGSALYLRYGEKLITDNGLNNSSTHLIPKGNLLVGTRVGVGKVAINLVDMAISQDLTGIIVAKDKCFPEFIAYQILSPRIQEVFRNSKRGVTIQGVSRDDIRTFRLFLPPLPEQRKIAAVLFKIQKAIELQDAIIERTRELKKSTMQFVFTHGLRGEKTKKTEIGEMPESWEVVSISECADVTTGGTPARTNETFWNNGTIPWVRTGEINYQTIEQTAERITEAGLANSAARIYPKGTLLIAMYGEGVTRGRVALLGIEAATNQACAAVTPRSGLLNEYLFCYITFAYERLRNQAHGANQQNLNTQLIKDFTFPKSDTDQQQKISELIRSVDKKLNVHILRKSALQDLFKTMLNKLMSGELRVKDLEIEEVKA